MESRATDLSLLIVFGFDSFGGGGGGISTTALSECATSSFVVRNGNTKGSDVNDKTGGYKDIGLLLRAGSGLFLDKKAPI